MFAEQCIDITPFSGKLVVQNSEDGLLDLSAYAVFPMMIGLSFQS